jgi:hypothetical protein
MALVSRDPFARTELHRERVYVTSAACDWCGGICRTKSGRHYLWQYRFETDGGRKYTSERKFCCKSCHDAYHR